MSVKTKGSGKRSKRVRSLKKPVQLTMLPELKRKVSVKKKVQREILYVRVKPQHIQNLQQKAKRANMSLSLYVDNILDQVIGL